MTRFGEKPFASNLLLLLHSDQTVSKRYLYTDNVIKILPTYLPTILCLVRRYLIFLIESSNWYLRLKSVNMCDLRFAASFGLQIRCDSSPHVRATKKTVGTCTITNQLEPYDRMNSPIEINALQSNSNWHSLCVPTNAHSTCTYVPTYSYFKCTIFTW